MSLAYTPNLYTLLSNHADRENNKEKFLNPLLAKALTPALSQKKREPQSILGENHTSRISAECFSDERRKMEVRPRESKPWARYPMTRVSRTQRE